MVDGPSVKSTWLLAISEAEARLRELLSDGKGWKRVSPSSNSSRDSSVGGVADSVTVYRRGDVYRVVLDVPVDAASGGTEEWVSVLSTPELRKEWDGSVDSAEIIEVFEQDTGDGDSGSSKSTFTRLLRTTYGVGWPASPRDSITLHRTLNETGTILDISCSIPTVAAEDEPGYLRVRPPIVRTFVNLMAWCIQLPPAQPIVRTSSTRRGQNTTAFPTTKPKLKLTLFHSHSLRLPLISSFPLIPYLSSLLPSLIRVVRERGSRIPRLLSYPHNGVGMSLLKWDVGREVLSAEYEIWSDDSVASTNRHVHFRLPGSGGWDVRHSSTSGNPSPSPSLSPEVAITRTQDRDTGDILLTMKHLPSAPASALSRPIRVSLRIELVSHSLGIRVNGVPAIISLPPTPSQLLAFDNTRGVDVASLHTLDASTGSDSTENSMDGSFEKRTRELREKEERRQKAILTRVKRNYIYFTSLLQEPEVKWTRYTESRGVSVSTLDTLSTSLIIYRAEAVFVGLGMWDIYSGVLGGWIRATWDKTYEEFDLIEDLGGVSLSGVSELWMEKTRGGWGVNPRESVLLRTVYKSPTAVHVFAFSPTPEDTPIFPSIPPPTSPSPTAATNAQTHIRTQVDLQGFSIERLSPTTTSLTLLTQSDTGRGWGGAISTLGMGSISKGMGMGASSGTPNQLINLVGGMGEYLIKFGAPPVLTSLRGGKSRRGGIKFDSEKSSLKLEYEAAEDEGEAFSEPSLTPADGDGDHVTIRESKLIECELRCDVDVWSPSGVELIVDPPPVTVTALRRHKLSEASGMWITVCHSTAMLYSLSAMADLDDPTSEGRVMVIVRKGKAGGGVICNGAKIDVQVEDLDEKEIQKMTRKKRVKPERIPLDVPPSPLKRRPKPEDSDDESEQERSVSATRRRAGSVPSPASPSTPSTPTVSSPLARMWKAAIEGTQQAVSSVAPPSLLESEPLDASLSPAQQALEALAYLRSYHSRAHFDGWALASNDAETPFVVYRKQQSSISRSLPVYKGEKVIEGWTAEDIAPFVTNFKCRKQWDDRFDGATVLEEYGSSFRTAFMCMKSIFPFRDRGFLVADACARLAPEEERRGRNGAWGSAPKSPVSSGSEAVTVFYASISFHPDHLTAAAYSSAKYNPYTLPLGRIFLDGWIFETLDPYTTTEHYAIPSTRVSRLVSMDFAGSMPAAYTSMINVALPRSVLNLRNFLMSARPLPLIRLPITEWFVEEQDDDPEEDLKWELQIRDSERMLVRAENDSAAKSVHAIIRVTPHFRISEPPETLGSPPRRQVSVSPHPRSLSREMPPEEIDMPPRTPTRTNRADTLPSSPPISPETIRGHRRVSSISGTTAAPVNIMPLVRSMPGGSIFTSPTFSAGLLLSHPDFCVAEVLVDPALYGETGYCITLHSVLDVPGEFPYSASTRDDEEASFPFISRVYSVPSDAMHPTRHLLRITLPTSQYFQPAIEDPLTGEEKKPLEKPAWLGRLEETGARIDMQINPKEKEMDSSSQVVVINGEPVRILGEKESLDSLGRKGLEGESIMRHRGRVRRSLRKPDEELVPKALATPVLIAEEMKMPAAAPSVEGQAANGEADHGNEAVPETPINPEAKEATNEAAQRASHSPNRKAPSGFRGFLDPLLRRRSSGPSRTGTGTNNSHGDADRRKGQIGLAVRDGHANLHYPLSTVVIVALISFLLGSLLRSLISPAEFVAPYPYATNQERVATSRAVQEEGWREIKRLVEIKYLVGGWDFVVAIVRRP